MAGQTCYFLLALVGAVVAHPFFRGPEGPDYDAVRAALSKCQDGDVDTCRSFHARQGSEEENGYCASMNPQSTDEWLEDHWHPFCRLEGISCAFQYPSTIYAHESVPIIGGEWVKVFENLLPAEVQAKIGRDGFRHQLLNVTPQAYGFWACQSWSQLSTAKDRPVFGAKNWAYTGDGSCYVGNITGIAHTNNEEADNLFSGIWGMKQCGCANPSNQIDDCRPVLSTVHEPMVEICEENPAGHECAYIDALGDVPSRDLCQSGVEVEGCAISKKIPDVCFHYTEEEPLPRGILEDALVMKSSAEDVAAFLTERSETKDPQEFAGFVGLSDLVNLGHRAKMVVPEFSAQNACRNVLDLVGNKQIPALPHHHAFVYKPDTKECVFVKLVLPVQAADPSTSIVMGPVWC